MLSPSDHRPWVYDVITDALGDATRILSRKCLASENRDVSPAFDHVYNAVKASDAFRKIDQAANAAKLAAGDLLCETFDASFDLGIAIGYRFFGCERRPR